MQEFTRCQECGSEYGLELEIGVLCLGCWDRLHGIDREPIRENYNDLPWGVIYDITTGRALPGHPGLA